MSLFCFSSLPSSIISLFFSLKDAKDMFKNLYNPSFFFSNVFMILLFPEPYGPVSAMFFIFYFLMHLKLHENMFHFLWRYHLELNLQVLSCLSLMLKIF